MAQRTRAQGNEPAPLIHRLAACRHRTSRQTFSPQLASEVSFSHLLASTVLNTGRRGFPGFRTHKYTLSEVLIVKLKSSITHVNLYDFVSFLEESSHTKRLLLFLDGAICVLS